MSEFVISSRHLRPQSLIVDPAYPERCDVASDPSASLLRNGAIAAGVALMLLGVFILAAGAGKMDGGVKGLLLGIVVLCFGLGQARTYSVDLQRNGSRRSLMTTDDYDFGRYVADLCNDLLARQNDARAYRVNPKAKWIKVEPTA